MKLVDSGLRSGGHDARQVLRVREEGEDVGQREGNPVGELELSGQGHRLREFWAFPQQTPPLARSARKILANE